jgi:hypothetical protein
MTIHRMLTASLLLASVGFAQSHALAQATPTPPAPSQPTTPPATPPAKPAKPEQPAEPTLDDLLGLPSQTPPPKPDATKETPEAAKPSSKDAAKAELDRKLAETEMNDEFEQAVQLMGDTAKRLGEAKDAGLDTQRMQEQTLAKLDKLIDMAKAQKNKSKKKQKQKQSEDQSQDQQQQQQSSQQQQQGQAKSQQAGTDAAGGNVPRQDGKLNAPPGAGAAWGNLPERLREALMQGSGDFTSAKWQALTREYYKRLAEQPGVPK